MGLNSIIDFSLTGGTDTSGKIQEFSGKKAFENAILLWLTSMQGDTVREPFSGGYVYPYLLKPLSDDNADAIQETIVDGLHEDFPSQINVQAVQVVPNYKNRRWDINVIGYSPVYNTSVNVEVSINAG
jgi:hypothetical protein